MHYLFKNNSECEDFIHKINEYDSQEYTIETTKKIIYQETKEEDFSQWKWQSINELSEVDFIPGIKNEISVAWEFYSNNKGII